MSAIQRVNNLFREYYNLSTGTYLMSFAVQQQPYNRPAHKVLIRNYSYDGRQND